MKLNKLFLLAGVAMLTFGMSSCSDDDDYTPGAPSGKYDVSFANEEAKKVLALDDKTFTVDVTRANGDGELTVPVEVLQKPDCFTVPQSITFAAGETEKSLEIAVADGMENFVDYTLRLRIPEAYTQAYKEDAGSPMLNMTVLKEDFKPWAEGVFRDNIIFKQAWNQTLEYSEIKDTYRLPDLIATGTHFLFKWNGKADDDSELYFCDSEGAKIAIQATGFVHPSYGMIMANFLYTEWLGFDSAKETFYFPIEFTVSAGTFGANYDTFTITKKY